MNHELPATPAALQAHIAELEQQLRLSDEGVSQLAQRCLELEQQLLVCQTELAKHSTETDNFTLTLPQLFYDTGSGFSPRECLIAAEDAHNELTHEVSVTFVLPEAPALSGWIPASWPAASPTLLFRTSASAFSRSTALCCRRTACCFWMWTRTFRCIAPPALAPA